MYQYERNTYGDRIADVYDDLHHAWDPTPAVDTIAELAGDGPVLELGVGTGRVALPLAAKGIAVTGVDISAAMLDRLSSKDPTGAVRPVLGDFVDVPVDGRFRVVFVVNSLLQLPGADVQQLCLRNIREHLTPDGVFIMEEANPAVFARSGVEVLRMTAGELHLLAAQYDPVHQHYFAHHVIMRDGRADLHPMSLRLTSTHEFDVMAELAGLRLTGRWGDWGRSTPFVATSRAHISCYRPAEAG